MIRVNHKFVMSHGGLFVKFCETCGHFQNVGNTDSKEIQSCDQCGEIVTFYAHLDQSDDER